LDLFSAYVNHSHPVTIILNVQLGMYTRIIITIFVWTEFDKSLIQYNYV